MAFKSCHYRGYRIEPDEWAGISFVHDDYDGPEDIRCGIASSLDDAQQQIDELEDSIADGTAIWPKPDAWSGGFADNH